MQLPMSARLHFRLHNIGWRIIARKCTVGRCPASLWALYRDGQVTGVMATQFGFFIEAPRRWRRELLRGTHPAHVRPAVA
jgi:hypothetical protein